MKIVREHIYEAFEGKDTEQKRSDILFPEINQIKNVQDFEKALKSGLSLDSIPKKKIDELIKNAAIYELSRYSLLLDIPDELIKQRLNSVKNINDVETLSNIGNISKEEYDNAISRILLEQGSQDYEIMWYGIGPSDPCINENIGYLSIEELEKNFEQIMFKFIDKNESDISILPVKIRDIMIYFSSSNQDIDFEFFLKRKYKDAEVGWNKFLDNFFPKRKEVTGWFIR